MIRVSNLTIQAGSFRLERISFEAPRNSYVVLMGPTASGKTTILEAICGLRPVAAGRIELDGIDVTRSKPAERGVGYVPQDAALFSTLTVREHLAFGLRIRRWPAAKVDARVAELAELLNLQSILERGPARLSGGERQRVALGRALAWRPKILCLDEPLSSLDESMRDEMYELLTRVKEHSHVTALHVTHSTSEATRLADVLLRLDDGAVRVVPLENGEAARPSAGRDETPPPTKRTQRVDA